MILTAVQTAFWPPPFFQAQVTLTGWSPNDTAIDFGDGSPIEHTGVNPDPYVTSHIYSATGPYTITAKNGVAPDQSFNLTIVAVEPPVVAPLMGPVPESWVTAADVMACCGIQACDDPSIFTAVAREAEMALYEISGRQFTGLLESKVRPSRSTCSCWGAATGMWNWSWSSGAWGGGGNFWGNWWWGWTNECGDRTGCPPLSVVRLAGYPVREILEVKIDGVVIPETPGLDAGDGIHFGGWRLDRWRRLTRMAIPGPPEVIDQMWPSCQDLSLEDTQDGTFSIKYLHGMDPPPLAQQAAAALGCQLYQACAGGDCVLPAGVTRVDRQGITVERGLLANWFNPNQGTGLPAVDMFLRAYWKKLGSRRPAVYSPDLQQFPLREYTREPT